MTKNYIMYETMESVVILENTNENFKKVWGKFEYELLNSEELIKTIKSMEETETKYDFDLDIKTVYVEFSNGETHPYTPSYDMDNLESLVCWNEIVFAQDKNGFLSFAELWLEGMEEENGEMKEIHFLKGDK